MSATAITLPVQPAGNPFTRHLGLLVREAGYELLRATRNRAFSLATIGFPVMFFLLFGLGNMHGKQGAVIVRYLLGGYTAFGAVGASLFGIGVALATERTSGWLELKRASPMPPVAYLLAKCTVAVVYSLAITSLLCALAVGVAHVHLSLSEFSGLMAVTAFAAVPFATLGLLLAAVVPPNAAAGVVQLVYLPMSFCSGLWMPISGLPAIVQRVAPSLPTYHLAQLMLGVLGYAEPGSSAMRHLLALLGFAAVFLAGAAAAFRRMDADQ